MCSVKVCSDGGCCRYKRSAYSQLPPLVTRYVILDNERGLHIAKGKSNERHRHSEKERAFCNAGSGLMYERRPAAIETSGRFFGASGKTGRYDAVPELVRDRHFARDFDGTEGAMMGKDV